MNFKHIVLDYLIPWSSSHLTDALLDAVLDARIDASGYEIMRSM